MTQIHAVTRRPINTPAQVLFASLIGTTIEFFDFYIYATAAVLVFPRLLFPQSDPASATLASRAPFAIALLSRPIGSAHFGHFGDRVGRKATLVAALLTMGVSTVLIGLLPTYGSVGVLAPALLALCRFGQGLGLGGEWGGAVLLAIENAPAGKRAWYGMYPQLGAPIGFLGATGFFLLLARALDDAEFLAWGWRVPFLLSVLLIALGLYVRLRLTDTPEFINAMARGKRVRLPAFTVFTSHPRALALATLAATAVFAIFYLMTVFALTWSTMRLGYTQAQALSMQMTGMLFLALLIPASAAWSDRRSARLALILAMLGLLGFGWAFGPLLASTTIAGPIAFSVVGLALAGLAYGPLGTVLAGLFPTAVRYTGISLAFNFA